MPGGTRRWIREQLPFLIVVIGIAACFAYLLLQPGHWRRGTAAIGVVTLLAGAMRLFLPTARLGFLAVRSRAVDVVLYLLVGGLILAVDIRLRT